MSGYQRRAYRGRDRDRKPYTVTGIATKALVAYGVCKLSSWAWTKLVRKEDQDENENVDGGEDYGITSSNAQSQSRSHKSKPPRKRQIAFLKKRRAKLQKCQSETVNTQKTLFHTLKSTIESLSDFSQQTRALKQMRRTHSHRNHQHDDDGSSGGDNKNILSSSSSSFKKQELWNIIKIKSMTRMIGTVYAHTILSLILTIQIHLLGGRIFHEGEALELDMDLEERRSTYSAGSDADDNGNKSDLNGHGNGHAMPEKECTVEPPQQQQQEVKSASHREVLLQTFEHFFQKGLRLLMLDVQDVVEQELGKWEVITIPNNRKEEIERMSESGEGEGTDSDSKRTLELEALGNITLEEFEKGVGCIRQTFEARLTSIEDESSSSSSSPPLAQYMFDFYTGTDDDMVHFIVDETLDIIESPVFEIAKQEALDLSFNILREKGYSGLFGDDDAATAAATTTAMPLASIMTKLKKVINSTFYSSPEVKTEDEWSIGPTMSSYPNIYLYHLSGMESMKELGDISFN